MTLKLIDTMTDSRTGPANEFEQTALTDWLSLEAPMNYRLGVDVSRHQGKMDWEKCAAQGVTFAAIRATVGDYYDDARFEENWQGARAAGLKVTAYHVVTPEKLVADQMENFFDTVHLHGPDIPFVLDCELTREQPPDVITDCIRGCAKNLIDIRGDNPIIYTRQSWWDEHVLQMIDWQKFPLWVASYTTALQPTLPRDWKTWLLWQYTSKGDGATYGAESAHIDLNRTVVVGDPPPEPEPTGMVRTTPYRLNVRTAPVVKDATRIGSVPHGTVFKSVRREGKWVVVEAYLHGDYVEEM